MVEGRGGGGAQCARYYLDGCYKKRQFRCVNQGHLSADHIRIPFLMSYDVTIFKYFSYLQPQNMHVLKRSDSGKDF